jgi:SMI1 / KNR4 family (SUKH-1)
MQNGGQPASSDEISSLEKGLGVTFSVTYREFLLSSNGGRPSLRAGPESS